LQGIIGMGNGYYNGISGMAEGDYNRAQVGFAEALSSGLNAKMMTPSGMKPNAAPKPTPEVKPNYPPKPGLSAAKEGRATYFPTDDAGKPMSLPRGPNGELAPSSMDPHTQIGWEKGRRGGYVQTRQFGSNGEPVKQVDWTDHGRPQQHTDPHVHDYVPNPTGGTPQHGAARPPKPGEFF
jgi:hypothetical protein